MLALLSMIPKLVRAIGIPAKSVKEQAQVVWSLIVAFMIAVYALIVIYALFDTVYKSMNSQLVTSGSSIATATTATPSGAPTATLQPAPAGTPVPAQTVSEAQQTHASATPVAPVAAPALHDGLLPFAGYWLGALSSGLYGVYQWLGLPLLGAWLALIFARVWGFLDRWAQLIVIGLAAIGVVLPSRRQVRDLIEQIAIQYLALIFYFNNGERRRVLVGQLRELLEHIAQREDRYAADSRVHLVAYSFGSVIAIDALFPIGEEPDARLRKVYSLTTIGSPFDFVRTYWPDYFERRTVPATKPRWYNIYSPDDIYASNFRDNSDIAEPQRGINNANCLTKRRPTQSQSYTSDADTPGAGGAERSAAATPSQPQTPGADAAATRQRERVWARLAGQRGVLVRMLAWCPSIVSRFLRWLWTFLFGDAKTQQPTSDTQKAATNEGPHPENIIYIMRATKLQLSWMDVFTFLGIRAHTMYWESVGDPQINCFDVFVKRVCLEEQALAQAITANHLTRPENDDGTDEQPSAPETTNGTRTSEAVTVPVSG